MDRGPCWAAVHGVAKFGHNLATKQQEQQNNSSFHQTVNYYYLLVSFYIIREHSGKEFRCIFYIHQILFVSLFCTSIQVLPHFRQRKQINSFLYGCFPLQFSPWFGLILSPVKNILYPPKFCKPQDGPGDASVWSYISVLETKNDSMIGFICLLTFVCFHNILE